SGVTASQAVLQVIERACTEGRVVNGIHRCANTLQSHPDKTMLCILPVDDATSDVAVNIEHTLLEAYCWENDIRVMKVDCSKKLEMLVLDNISATNDSLTDDFTCVLIMLPKQGEEIRDWKTLDTFFKDMMKQGLPHWHVIGLPG
ncbi:hypothetical protein FSP39_008952, partial [Pinctada imbricata]